MEKPENDKKQYLPEDQDLIDQLEKIKEMTPGQTAEQHKKDLSSIQIKATLRSRKSMSNFDKSTTVFSKILIVFTIIQIIIALIQFSLSAATSGKPFYSLVLTLVLIGMIIWILISADEEF